MLDNILVTHVIKAKRVQTKSGNGAIGCYPRSKLPFRGILYV